MSSSYLLLLDAFYLGLKLKERRGTCKLPISKLLRWVETYPLLNTRHGLGVPLRGVLTLMLQPLLTRKRRQNQTLSYGRIERGRWSEARRQGRAFVPSPAPAAVSPMLARRAAPQIAPLRPDAWKRLFTRRHCQKPVVQTPSGRGRDRVQGHYRKPLLGTQPERQSCPVPTHFLPLAHSIKPPLSSLCPWRTQVKVDRFRHPWKFLWTCGSGVPRRVYFPSSY